MLHFTLTRFCDSPSMGCFGTLVEADAGPFAGFFSFTVEQPWNDNEVGHSCIPAGTYACKKLPHPKHGLCWEVQDVPGRSAILIHAGNVMQNFEGCIGLGDSLGALALDEQHPAQWCVKNSQTTLDKFMAYTADVDTLTLTVEYRHHD